jgi:hypothetical protein
LALVALVALVVLWPVMALTQYFPQLHQQVVVVVEPQAMVLMVVQVVVAVVILIMEILCQVAQHLHQVKVLRVVLENF